MVQFCQRSKLTSSEFGGNSNTSDQSNFQCSFPSPHPRYFYSADLAHAERHNSKSNHQHRTAMYQLDSNAFVRLDGNTYVYDIQPVAGNIATISSDNNLRVIDPLALNSQAVATYENVHDGVTCLKTLNNDSSIVVTAGSDGRVNVFDSRLSQTAAKVATFETGEHKFSYSHFCSNVFVARIASCIIESFSIVETRRSSLYVCHISRDMAVLEGRTRDIINHVTCSGTISTCCTTTGWKSQL